MKEVQGMGLFSCSPLVLLRLDFGGSCQDVLVLAWVASVFNTAILDVWRGKVADDLCRREGFRSGPLLDIFGS